jgi:hypothetical protein
VVGRDQDRSSYIDRLGLKVCNIEKLATTDGSASLNVLLIPKLRKRRPTMGLIIKVKLRLLLLLITSYGRLEPSSDVTMTSIALARRWSQSS